MQSLLVCPGCRRLNGDVLDVHTIEPAGDVLACTSCARRYPIVDGVPIVLADPGPYLRTEIGAVVERDDLPLEVAALLVEFGADDAPYARLLEHVSIYMDAHWGDRADPPGGFAAQTTIDKLRALPHVSTAVELGCSAGRIAFELAHTADEVLAIDLQFATLCRARRLLGGEPMRYGRRMVGRHYAPVSVPGQRSERVRFVCSDALDPPLVPRMYDRVVALNLLDAVHHPATLLDVVHGLCAPGGEIVLSSPYAWQSGTVVEDGRLGGASPAVAVGAWFGKKGYEVEDQGDLAWPLRRDARSAVHYQTHYLRVRKPDTGPTV